MLGKPLPCTPLVRLHRLPKPSGANVFLKLESFNPTHSYKDRMAQAMLFKALERGEIGDETTVLECTGGSTGPALAYWCARAALPLKVISSDAYAQEKLDHMRALGADLEIVPSVDGKVTPDLWPRMMERAEQLTSEGGHHWLNQFHNRDALFGYHQMAEEILEQVGGLVDVFCAAVGTAGMLMGVGKVLKKSNPELKLVALEPSSSAVLSGREPGKHNIDGTAAGFIPPLYEADLVDQVLALPETEARSTARELARQEGYFCGTSSGLNVAAALKLAAALDPSKVVVTVACDSGLKYLNQGLFD